jgi:hypothetical protein
MPKWETKLAVNNIGDGVTRRRTNGKEPSQGNDPVRK